MAMEEKVQLAKKQLASKAALLLQGKKKKWKSRDIKIDKDDGEQISIHEELAIINITRFTNDIMFELMQM